MWTGTVERADPAPHENPVAADHKSEKLKPNSSATNPKPKPCDTNPKPKTSESNPHPKPYEQVDLDCLCFRVIIDGTRLSCGHLLCRACWTRHVHTSVESSVRCPYCRKSIELGKDEKSWSMSAEARQKMRIRCPFAAESCRWTGSVAEALDNHVFTCAFRPMAMVDVKPDTSSISDVSSLNVFNSEVVMPLATFKLNGLATPLATFKSGLCKEVWLDTGLVSSPGFPVMDPVLKIRNQPHPLRFDMHKFQWMETRWIDVGEKKRTDRYSDHPRTHGVERGTVRSLQGCWWPCRGNVFRLILRVCGSVHCIEYLQCIEWPLCAEQSDFEVADIVDMSPSSFVADLVPLNYEFWSGWKVPQTRRYQSFYDAMELSRSQWWVDVGLPRSLSSPWACVQELRKLHSKSTSD